jgi:hypothetical protein
MIRVCIFTLSSLTQTNMDLVEFVKPHHSPSGNVFINLGAN